MKKISLVATGLAAIGVLSFGHLVQAEETTASVKVNPGELKLTKVDNISFQDVTVKKGGSTASESGKASINIEDLRGSSSKGWTLTAKLKDENFGGMGLKLAPTITSNKTAATAGAPGNLNKDPQTVASVEDDKIKTTEFDTEVIMNASLNVPEKQLANTYTTTIVWNLAEGPGTK